MLAGARAVADAHRALSGQRQMDATATAITSRRSRNGWTNRIAETRGLEKSAQA
jgi:hypothetical protein